MIIVMIIVFIVFDVLIAAAFQEISEMKGYTERKYFWYSVFFTLAGWLMIVALPDRKQKTVEEADHNRESEELPDL